MFESPASTLVFETQAPYSLRREFRTQESKLMAKTLARWMVKLEGEVMYSIVHKLTFEHLHMHTRSYLYEQAYTYKVTQIN